MNKIKKVLSRKENFIGPAILTGGLIAGYVLLGLFFDALNLKGIFELIGVCLLASGMNLFLPELLGGED